MMWSWQNSETIRVFELAPTQGVASMRNISLHQGFTVEQDMYGHYKASQINA